MADDNGAERGQVRIVHGVGMKVWVADPVIGWTEGKVEKVNELEQRLTVAVSRLGERGERVSEIAELDAAECPLANEHGRGGVEDMVKLSYLHEPGVLANLHGRFDLDEIYTYTGSILIAVNPFRRLPHLYDVHMMEQYRGMEIGELSPHVFAIADVSYRAMIREGKSQSILVSGESGAGKTETTKYLMAYLAHVGGRSKTGIAAGSEGGGGGGGGVDGSREDSLVNKRSVEQQVLESNPLLEAFGNAKTVRNDNSSRFGKFVEIQFDGAGRISGAAIRTYLLERSRVVSLTDPERNYHIFYQLCDGPDAQLYNLKSPKHYHYLNQSTCTELKGYTNAEAYAHTKRAMEIVGLTAKDQDAVFRAVASVLELGNVSFEAAEEDSCRVQAGAGEEALAAAAQLLGVEVEGLRSALTIRSISTFDGIIKKPLTVAQAVDARDSLSKTIYSRLFDWLVDRINVSIGQDESSTNFIGVLDIYGFESFKHNSFEQLCINLANEKLQQHFNQHVFKMEQEEYEAEAIDWSYIEFVDNQDALDLIESKRDGILAVLDEACMLANTTPENFVEKLVTTHKSHKRLSKPKRSQVEFAMEHYAGGVTYDTTAFIDKNKDYVNADHQELLQVSERDLIQTLFPVEKEPAAPSGGGGGGGKRGKQSNKFVSVGTRFKGQLAELMKTLSYTEPHYIRCVKPNMACVPGEFEAINALHQLRCGGVLEAVRISCAGFPARKPFGDFVDRFGILTPQLLNAFKGDSADRQLAAAVLDASDMKGYQLGKTKVFLRAGQMALLDKLRSDILNAAATSIQMEYRRHVQQNIYQRQRNAALLVQACCRGMLARSEARRRRNTRAATIIQTRWRGKSARAGFLKTRKSTVAIQSAWRGQKARKQALAMRYEKSAKTIQSAWKCRQARVELQRVRRAAISFQCAWRSKMARRELKKLRIEAREVGGLMKAKNELAQRVEAMHIRIEVEKQAKEAAQQELEAARQATEEAQAAAESAATAAAAAVAAERAAEMEAERAARAEAEEARAKVEADLQAALAQAEAVGPNMEALEALAAEKDAAAAELRTAKDAAETRAAELEALLEQAKSDIEHLQGKAQRLEEQNVMLSQQARDASAKLSKLTAGGRLAGVNEDTASPDSANSANERRMSLQAMRASKMGTAGGDSQRRAENTADYKALLTCVREEIGFTNGRPVAACLVFRSLLHWRSFEQEKTVIFEHIIATITSATDPHMENNEVLAYWLSNASTLQALLQRTLRTTGTSAPQGRRRSSAIFLRWNNGFRSSPASGTGTGGSASPTSSTGTGGDERLGNSAGGGTRQVDAKYPALLFKQQLTAFVEKLFTQIRDNLKKSVTPLLGSCIQAPRLGRSSSGGQGGASRPRGSSGAGSGAADSPWKQILTILQELLEVMKGNLVPTFLVRKLFSQLFSFINVQLFNSLLLRRECCSFSNGEYVKTGLADMENWIHSAGAEWIGNAWDELKFIRQAVTFLVIHQKPRKTLDEIIHDVCPVLSVQQLYRISTMYWDDKYGTETVSSDVLQHMRKLMMEDANGALSNSFLLDDDSSIPFAIEEIASAMPLIQLNDTPVPPALKGNESFVFLSSPVT